MMFFRNKPFVPRNVFATVTDQTDSVISTIAKPPDSSYCPLSIQVINPNEFCRPTSTQKGIFKNSPTDNVTTCHYNPFAIKFEVYACLQVAEEMNVPFNTLDYFNLWDDSLRETGTDCHQIQDWELEPALPLSSDTRVKMEQTEEENTFGPIPSYGSGNCQQASMSTDKKTEECMAPTFWQCNDQTPIHNQQDLFTGTYHPLSSCNSTLTSAWEAPQPHSHYEDARNLSTYEEQQQAFDLTFSDSHLADDLYLAKYPETIDSSSLWAQQQPVPSPGFPNDHCPTLNNLPPQWTVDTIQNFENLFNTSEMSRDPTLPSLRHPPPFFDKEAGSYTIEEMQSFERDQSDAPSSHRDRSKDALLLHYKAQGMTYKQIKEKGNFTEAESTLRGRYRTLTKSKEDRVRKPKWTELDIANLCGAVSQYLATNPYLEQPNVTLHIDPQDEIVNKIPWKQIAKDIASRGSYSYGNATVKKKFKEVLQSGRPWNHVT